MNPKYRKRRLLSSAESDRGSPSVPTADREGHTKVKVNYPAETPDFPEGHEDPEQSAELERQQDA
jgi:hypothetical protein